MQSFNACEFILGHQDSSSGHVYLIEGIIHAILTIMESLCQVTLQGELRAAGQRGLGLPGSAPGSRISALLG